MNIFTVYEQAFLGKPAVEINYDFLANEWKAIVTKYSKIELNYSRNRVGPGWWSTLDNCFSDIETVLQNSNSQEKLNIVQIKEKFGHISIKHKKLNNEVLNAEIEKIILAAQIKTDDVCEVCGEHGKLRDLPWLKTLCDHHYELKLHSVNEPI